MRLSFPRARGDRPPFHPMQGRELRLPPRTRGSTQCHRWCRCHILASPAHAGIDLGPSMPPLRLRSFPRARGDRPMPRPQEPDKDELPPRTRGSTLWLSIKNGTAKASPAHAGIDPSPVRMPAPRPGFPRARGDRPSRTRALVRDGWLPPRTRGSTLERTFMPPVIDASPAHAGIDREIAARWRGVLCFPRARGDRPLSAAL